MIPAPLPTDDPAVTRRRRPRIVLAGCAAALVAGLAIAIPLSISASRTAEAEREARTLTEGLAAAAEVAQAPSTELAQAVSAAGRYLDTVMLPVGELVLADGAGFAEETVASVQARLDELAAVSGLSVQGRAELSEPFVAEGYAEELARALRAGDDEEREALRAQVGAERERLEQVARDSDQGVRAVHEALGAADDAVLGVVGEAQAAVQAAVESHPEASEETKAQVAASIDALARFVADGAGIDRTASGGQEPWAEVGSVLTTSMTARAELAASHEQAVAERLAAEEAARAAEAARVEAERAAEQERARQAKKGSSSGGGGGGSSSGGSSGGGGGWYDKDGNVCSYVDIHGMLIIAPCG